MAHKSAHKSTPSAEADRTPYSLHVVKTPGQLAPVTAGGLTQTRMDLRGRFLSVLGKRYPQVIDDLYERVLPIRQTVGKRHSRGCPGQIWIGIRDSIDLANRIANGDSPCAELGRALQGWSHEFHLTEPFMLDGAISAIENTISSSGYREVNRATVMRLFGTSEGGLRIVTIANDPLLPEVIDIDLRFTCEGYHPALVKWADFKAGVLYRIEKRLAAYRRLVESKARRGGFGDVAYRPHNDEPFEQLADRIVGKLSWAQIACKHGKSDRAVRTAVIRLARQLDLNLPDMRRTPAGLVRTG